MKKNQMDALAIILIASVIFITHIYRSKQKEPEPETEISFHQSPQWHLPDNAKLRYGKGSINQIEFSHDNSTLAVATTIGLWLYDGQSGKELALLMPHISVNAIAFSPDGKTLASGGDDKLVSLWNMPEGTHKQTLSGHTDKILKMKFSADGKTLASTSTNEINLRNMTSSTHKQSFHRFNLNRDTHITLNGEQVVFTDVDSIGNTVEIEYLGNEKQNKIFDANLPTIWAMTFSPDGKILAYEITESEETKDYGNKDNSIILRNVDTGELVQEINNTSRYDVECMTFSADGKTLITANVIEGTLSLWDVETGQEKKTISCDPHRPRYVSISPDGKSLVSWSDEASFYLWDIPTGKSKQIITGHPYWPYILSSSLSADGKTLASSDSILIRDNFYLSDITTGKQIKIYDGHTRLIRDTEFNPDGTILATCSEDDTIRLWDATTGKKLKTIKIKKEILFKFKLAFSIDGETLAVASRNEEIYLWNVNTGRRKKTLTGVINNACHLFFSPDGQHLASISSKNDFYVGNVSTGKQNEIFAEQIKNVSNAAFSPDGTTLAITFKYDNKNKNSDEPKRSHQIELWNVADATKEHTYIGHIGDVTNAIFSPDGKILATGSKDKTIRLWDVTTGQQKHVLVVTGPQEHVFIDGNWLIGKRIDVEYIKLFAFSPDGKILATGIDSGNIYLWDTETGEQKKTLKGHTKQIMEISFSADGRTFTSMSRDNTVLVWDLASILSAIDKSD